MIFIDIFFTFFVQIFLFCGFLQDLRGRLADYAKLHSNEHCFTEKTSYKKESTSFSTSNIYKSLNPISHFLIRNVPKHETKMLAIIN